MPRADASGALLTVDHFQPRSQGGSDDLENLVYCCHACNEFKGEQWQPDSSRRILHPQRDDLAAHITLQEDGTLRALSQTGAFHIVYLQLNRPQLVAYRLERSLRTLPFREREADFAERFARLERQVQDLVNEIARLKQGG